MILVTLGTQDKSFSRLLDSIENAIKSGEITDEVIVQAGLTKYKSNYMKIYDLVSQQEFENLMERADIVITHGGVGSILSAIKHNKPVIAAARLKKYKEHTNDHQKQIIEEFKNQGYIIELRDFNKIGKIIDKAKNFKQKKFISNTDNMVNLISNYIESDNHVSWYNKYREVLLYILFGGLTTLVNIISFFIFRKLSISIFNSNVIAWILSVLFAFITNKIFVFESKNHKFRENLIEIVSFFGFRILSLVFDILFMYVLIDILSFNEMLSKIISNIFVIILNYVFSKLFIFKEKK